jgi:hypothetical protein
MNITLKIEETEHNKITKNNVRFYANNLREKYQDYNHTYIPDRTANTDPRNINAIAVFLEY